MPGSYLVSLAVLMAAAGFAGYAVVRVAGRLSCCDVCGRHMHAGNEGSCAACGTDACTRCLTEDLAEAPGASTGTSAAGSLKLLRLPMCPHCRAAIDALAGASLPSCPPAERAPATSRNNPPWIWSRPVFADQEVGSPATAKELG